MSYTNLDFTKEVNSIFNLDFLSKKREPITVDSFSFKSLPETRVNSYLVKLNNSEEYSLGEINTSEIKNFIKLCNNKLDSMGLSTKDRYCFLTLDQGYVEENTTLRTPGWHIDGMQGDEVKIKAPGDITFIWSNVLPTKFVNQGFNVDGLDPSTQNFNHVGAQVKEENVFVSEPNQIYLISPYHVHEANIATEKVFRIFLRLSYTFTPVTSTKMTINPEINYNYPYHITTGEIPSHLK